MPEISRKYFRSEMLEHFASPKQNLTATQNFSLSEAWEILDVLSKHCETLASARAPQLLPANQQQQASASVNAGTGIATTSAHRAGTSSAQSQRTAALPPVQQQPVTTASSNGVHQMLPQQRVSQVTQGVDQTKSTPQTRELASLQDAMRIIIRRLQSEVCQPWRFYSAG